MHISEVLSEEMAEEGLVTVASIVTKMEKQIAQIEQIVPMVSAENIKKLREYMIRLMPCKALLQEDQKLQLWKLSYRLWNACVDMANAMQAGQQYDEEHVKLRHLASDFLLIAGKVDGIPSSLLKIATFFHRTGVIWHKIHKFELAASCFEKATELISKSKENENLSCDGEEGRKFSFELLISRARTAWEMSQRTLTCTLLGRAKGLLLDATERYRELAEQYLYYGKTMLAKTEEGGSADGDSVKFLNQAFEICSEALVKCLAKSDERVLLENVRLKTLRYLAAAHLQVENFDSVLKCVAVLKDESDHPTTPFLALKAYIGLGLSEDAEKELGALLGHSGAPLDICISAVEIFIQSGSGGWETARSAFFRLQNRFPSKKELPVRVLDKILRNVSSADPSYKAKVALALQIATDERIIKFLAEADEHSSSERRCVHAILWNRQESDLKK